MMAFPPVPLFDIIFLLAIAAIALLLTAELSSPTYGLTNLAIRKKSLRNVITVTVGLMLVVVSIRIITTYY